MYKNGFDYKSKALDYYWKLLKENDYDPRNLKELLEDGNVGSSILSDTWWEDSNLTFSGMFLSHFKTKEVLDMFDFYKPPTHLTEQEIQEQCCNGDFYTYDNYAPKCQNTKCENYRNDGNDWCSYSDWADACLVDTVYNILFAFEIGGWSAIDELKPYFDKRIINRISETLPSEYVGIKEKEIYGDDTMSDLVKLIKTLNVTDNERNNPSVFWTDNMMYVEDDFDNKFTIQTDLYLAWKFAHIFELDFDYDATDKQVMELGKMIMDDYEEDCEEKEKIVDINKYFDDIKKDFNEILLVDWNDIDWQQTKRQIVHNIEEMPFGCVDGTATFIANWLCHTINEHIGDTDEYGHMKVIYADDDIDNMKITYPIVRSKENAPKFRDNHPNTDTLRRLRDKYLENGKYDIIAFAKALKEVKQYQMSTPKNFNEYLLKASGISEKCYYLLCRLLQNNREYENDILVGYIDWFGDYEENERYIYCHIDSVKNEIYFHENREHSCKSAYLHDIAFPHLVGDPSRIQEDIIIKFTEQYINDIVSDKMHDIYGIDGDPYFGNEWGYNYCHMYGTTGQYAL